MRAFRTQPPLFGKFRQLAEILVFLLCLLAGGSAELPQARAQQAPAQRAILPAGDAAVTGFSGAIPPIEIQPGVDPGDLTFIDTSGASLRIVDLQHMPGLPTAQLVKAGKPYSWFAGQIGQVFGVAIDDATPPNIYVAATSAYGLPIVVSGPDGKPLHAKTGAPNASFMAGLWGAAAPDGGPGSIWKIDGVTGAVSLFANVTLDGRPNSGPALGGLAFDPASKSLFVADRETGFIHHFALNGAELGRYDHGMTGRAALGFAPVPFDPSKHLDIRNPQFDSREPATWNYAAPERRIFGIGILAHRLYYAVADGLQIWSVSLNPDGSLGTDAQIEIVVPPAAGPTEISKIAFDEQNRMYLAERPAPTGAFNFEALSEPGIGRVLRYAQRIVPPYNRLIWQEVPDEYAVGFPLNLRNGNGGVAIGYRYDRTGALEFASCGGFLWATGEDLRDSSDPAIAEKLAQSGPPNVDGLQGDENWRIKRNDEPPLHAYFIDYDDKFDDTAARGHMGDVTIPRSCTPAPPSEGMILPYLGGTPEHYAPGHPHLPPKCPPNSSCPPPPTPPPCPPGTSCPPPTPCPPGQGRGRHDPQCHPCMRPNALIGGTCCTPADLAPGGACTGTNPGCQSGQTPLGPSGACCPNDQIYTNASGVQSCCLSGPVTNGQCQPPNPVPPGCTTSIGNPNCCPSGYVPSGNSCCLASQMTSTGVCCPAGQAPSGLGKAQCLSLIPIPIGGPSCCKNGLIPVGISGACCAPANVTTTGICCEQPVDPNDRSHCPAQIQSIMKCADGYTKMPDGSCCLNRYVSADGKSCHKPGHVPPQVPPYVPPPPVIDCAARGHNFIRDPNDPSRCIVCREGQVPNAARTACERTPRQPSPPVVDCAEHGPNFIRDPHHPGRCLRCGRGRVANDNHTACTKAEGPPHRPLAANCAARGRNFIHDPRDPANCIACGRGFIANRNRTACIRISGPREPGIYAPPPHMPPPHPPWRFGPGGPGRPFFPGGGRFIPR